MNKENLKAALKLYGLSVLATVFNVLIYVSFVALTGIFADKETGVDPALLTAANVVTLIFQLLLFANILYSCAWQYGNKDLNAVKFNRMPEDKLRGLKIGLIASIPAFASFVLLVAEKLFGFWSGYTALYRLGHLGFYPAVIWSLGTDLSVTVAGIGWGGVLLAGLPILVLPLVAFIGYRIGYADILLAEKLVYKSQNKAK